MSICYALLYIEKVGAYTTGKMYDKSYEERLLGREGY